jgi:hypothetical protein
MLTDHPIHATAAAVDLHFGMAKAAWFKDSEGNTYELSEVMGG